jgi:hypothetical protein
MNYNIAYKARSFREDVGFVVLQRDTLGWKLDAYGTTNDSVRDGDTYQDSLDELMPFLKLFVNSSTQWQEYDSGRPVSFWDIVCQLTDTLE